MRPLSLFLIPIFTSFSSVAFSQGYSLSGTVRSENAPVQMATVSVNKGKFLVYSDTAGKFTVTGLDAGRYELVIRSSGYQPYRTLVEIPNTSVLLPAVVLKPQVRQLDVVTIVQNTTARRKQESALNLEVVNSEFIKRNLGGSLMQSLERLPGVKTIGIGSGQSKPLIRGLGFNRVLAVEKGLKHEGQQWGADHGLEIDQFAASEVELIKGAASFLYGADAIGGVIDVKPASIQPKHAFGGSVDLVSKTNNGLYGTSVNLFRRTAHWFFDGRFTWQQYGDYRVPGDTVYVYDFAVRLQNQHLRNTAGRESGLHGTVGYVKQRFRSVLYLSNISSESGFFANAHGLEPRRVDDRLHDASSRDIQRPSQQVNHLKAISRTAYTTGNHRLELDFGFQHNHRLEFSPYVNHGYMPAVYPDTMSIPRDLEREFDKRVYSLNLRDELLWGKHTLTAGIAGEIQDNRINGWSFLVPAFRQQTAGAYLYDKFRVNERLVLHGALRYDFGHLQIAKYTDWFPSEREQDGLAMSEKLVRANPLTRRFNSLVWSAGLNYNQRQWRFKANVGKSFRMPIAKELAANGVNYHYFSYERGNTGLSPEQSYQADIDLSWENTRWFLQLSPFVNYFTNYIYLNPTAAHDFYYGAGNQVFEYTQSRVMRFGGEVHVRYNVLKNLRAEMLGEYLSAQQLSGAKKGYALPFSPPPSVLLNLCWSPLTGEKFTGTYLSVDLRLTAAQNKIVPPEKKTPGYRLVHLQAGTEVRLRKQVVKINFQVHNLLDTRYLNHTSFYRLISLPETGRNFILSAKIPFQFPVKNK